MTIKQAFENTKDKPQSTRAKEISIAMLNSGFEEPKVGALEKVLYTAMRLSTEESINRRYNTELADLIDNIFETLTSTEHATLDSDLKYDIDKYLRILGLSPLFRNLPVSKRQPLLMLAKIKRWRSKIRPE